MKRKNHKEWHLDEIQKSEIPIPVVDTSVTSTLYQNAPDFKPYYSVDICFISIKDFFAMSGWSPE